jgi:hypoxanthine phosphoribosyltransferase
MDNRSLEAVYSAEEISRRVGELGEEISRDYAGQVPILVSILKGSVVFLADLMRSISIPVHLDFMAITNFAGNRKPGGVVRILKDIDLPVSSRPVIIVEDIIDTGLTAGYLVKSIQARDPRSLQICALLDRQVRRLAQLPLRYVGFEVPDRFLVGYGLDHREIYRNLPYLARLPEEEAAR